MCRQPSEQKYRKKYAFAFMLSTCAMTHRVSQSGHAGMRQMRKRLLVSALAHRQTVPCMCVESEADLPLATAGARTWPRCRRRRQQMWPGKRWRRPPRRRRQSRTATPQTPFRARLRSTPRWRRCTRLQHPRPGVISAGQRQAERVLPVNDHEHAALPWLWLWGPSPGDPSAVNVEKNPKPC